MAITPRLIPLRLPLRRKLQPQLRNWRQIRAQCPPRSHPTLTNLQYRGDAFGIAGNCVELTNSFYQRAPKKVAPKCCRRAEKKTSLGGGANRSSRTAPGSQRFVRPEEFPHSGHPTTTDDHRYRARTNLLLLAASSFSTVEVFEDCSGGNSRLSYLFGCGGRSFFINYR